MGASLKTTPLNPWHRNAGANMADFGGYEMPLWYGSGVKNEHLAVLTSAGLFDTSHMACILVQGPGAFNLLNFCFTRDLSGLVAGRCVYGAFLNEQGYCIDDAIVYKFYDSHFMICVNAGMGGKVAAHLKAHLNAPNTLVQDLTGVVAKMDIQGKNAAKILGKCLGNPEAVFQTMPYFSFKGDFRADEEKTCEVRLDDGTPILLSRSGYTGEFGFEIFIAPGAILPLWERLLEAGQDLGISPCGLGARDSLRAGACLPLSHQDIGNFPFKNHPWTFALPYGEEGFTKNFLGAAALLSDPDDSFVYPFAGETLRKVNAGEESQVCLENGGCIGRVLTCATDMGITRHQGRILSINTPDLPKDVKIKGISCGFVKVSTPLESGARVTLKEGKRTIPATIVTDIRPDRTARMKLARFI